MPITNILTHLNEFKQHIVPRPAKGSPDIILITCHIQDGIGDFLHLYEIAKEIILKFPHYRFALILDIPGYNKAVLDLLLDHIDEFEILFEQMMIRVRFDAIHSFSDRNKQRVYGESHQCWYDYDLAFQTTLLNRVMKPYSKLQTIKDVAKQCCLVINISSILSFEAKHTSEPIQFEPNPHSVIVPELIESILVQLFFKKIPIIAINELGYYTNMVFRNTFLGLIAERESDLSAVKHHVYDVNMGLNDDAVGVRLYPQLSQHVDEALLGKVIQPELKNALRKSFVNNNRYIAIAFLRSDFHNTIFMITQIRRALKNDDRLDIYIPRYQYPQEMMNMVLELLAKELELDSLPVTVVSLGDDTSTSQIEIILHDLIDLDDYNLLWQCADYATSGSGDDGVSRMLSAKGLPMMTYNSATKKLALYRLAAYFGDGYDTFQNYFKRSIEKDAPNNDDLNCPFNPDEDKKKRKNQCQAVLDISKRTADAITPDVLEEWAVIRRKIANDANLFNHLGDIINVGLQLAKRQGVLKESIASKMLYSVSKQEKLFFMTVKKYQNPVLNDTSGNICKFGK